MLCLVVYAVSMPAQACDGDDYIRMRGTIALTDAQRSAIDAMPPLRIMAVDAPPLAHYDSRHATYTGISVDVLCFIANQVGLEYEIIPGRDLTVLDKIKQVQHGDADVFMPLSHSSAREQKGIFTLPYYQSYYAVIARKGLNLPIYDLADLQSYQVGVVEGVAFEPILERVVPTTNLHRYSKTSSDGLFQALRNGELDVVVFNKNIFSEKRYDNEYFDLEVIHTLTDNPRGYRFYFSPSTTHQTIVGVFDQYLARMDISDLIPVHQSGERQLLERYVAQRSQRTLLQGASIVAVLLAFVFLVVLRKYRGLNRRLAESNTRILEQQRALQEAYDELEKQSQTDSLTRLANRRHFDKTLLREHARHQRAGAPLSVLLIDVDHFKAVNDHYGHAVGDDYLYSIARVLQDSVSRPPDLAARYGGEEFTCLLPDTDAVSALVVANRIRDGVAQLELPNAGAGASYVTISVGIATLAGSDISVRGLLAAADGQLYAAKTAGRNRIMATTLT